ncbi:MAG: propionyl-CoA carboxylase, partial [Nannocystaceae bacterium]|nr:propionyl-CoA carboxylase [Nannocystaceae bacterium]
MVHVPLTPIGRARASFCDDNTFESNLSSLAAREEQLRERRAEVHAGWGEKYVGRVHAKGKMTARERLDAVKDPGSRSFEVGTFVGYGLEYGDKGLKSPGAGVVTAFAQVHGRWCMVIANDNT